MSSGKIAAMEKEHNFLQDKAADDGQRVQELENKNRLAATQITELHMQVRGAYERGGADGPLEAWQESGHCFQGERRREMRWAMGGGGRRRRGGETKSRRGSRWTLEAGKLLGLSQGETPRVFHLSSSVADRAWPPFARRWRSQVITRLFGLRWLPPLNFLLRRCRAKGGRARQRSRRCGAG